MWADLHPPLTAFPLALVITVAILEVINLFKPRPALQHAIMINLVILVAGVLAAFFSGYGAAENASRMFTVPQDQITNHHNLGRLALFTVVPCAALRLAMQKAKRGRGYFSAAYAVFFLLLLALIILTGRQGGRLVFDYGAGVKVVESLTK